MVFLLSSVVFFHLGRLRCECSFDRPSRLESVEKRRLFDSCDSRPFSDAESSSPESKIRAGAAILCLLRFCCPDTVLRRIRSLIILPFQGMLRRWAWPHVFVEGFKGIEPPLANCDSPCAVTEKSGVIRSIATAFHRVPDLKLARACESVCCFGFAYPVLQQATARLCVAGCEVLCLYDHFPAALTLAEPVGSFVLSSIFRNYCESVEVSVCKINLTRHGSSRLGTVLTGPIGSSIPIGPLS